MASVQQRIEWIEDEARFAAVAPDWDRLASRTPTPFGRHAWFSAWWSAFGGGRRLMICALWRDGELAAMFPLCARRGRLDALANVHTPLFRPLASDPAALETIVREAVCATAGELHVPALPAGDPALASLLDGGRGEGRLVLIEPDQTSPLLATDGPFEEYRAQMKRHWREIERRRRKLEREHETSYTLIEPPADLETELLAGLEVEASGWKGRAGTAILSAQDTTAFYTGVARAFHESGELRLSSMRVDGHVVAFDLCLLDRGRLYLLKTGYDESLSRLAPGMALRLAVVERCFELGLQAHELLGDDLPWKRQFATEEREHRTFRCYRRRPLPGLRYAYRRGARPVLKRAYRAVRERGR